MEIKVLVFCKQQSGGRTAHWLEEIVHNSEVKKKYPLFQNKATNLVLKKTENINKYTKRGKRTQNKNTFFQETKKYFCPPEM